MNESMIREILQRKPFQPFQLCLSSGETHEIRHPENVLLTKTRIVVATPETDGLAIVSLLHINSLKLLQNA